jgi:hypothetical protein
MVATSTAVRGLSTSDLEQIRDSLKGGRKPKVVFTESAGQIAGQHGQVVQLTDPQLSDEWVVVRFGRDELPFSPADLAIPAKGTAARRPDASTQTTGPAGVVTVPAPREETVVPSSPASTLDATTEKPADKTADKPADKTADKTADKPADRGVDKLAADKAGGRPADRQNGVAVEAPKASPRKALPKVKPPAALTVTLAYAEGEWTVGAQQGSRALAKPYVIRPAEALKMVSMLDVPGVHEAVEEIVANARAAAEREAQRLRTELAEIEAKLADLATG